MQAVQLADPLGQRRVGMGQLVERAEVILQAERVDDPGADGGLRPPVQRSVRVEARRQAWCVPRSGRADPEHHGPPAAANGSGQDPLRDRLLPGGGREVLQEPQGAREVERRNGAQP